jgi:hypothetical protein
MTTQSTIETVDRLLKRGQAVPSQMIRNLVIDCKAQIALNNALKKRVEVLEIEKRALVIKAKADNAAFDAELEAETK